jgi:hypothetical protein
MKKWSPSLAIKEMQIKTTIRFHFTVRIPIIKNTSNNRFWGVCGEKRNPHKLMVGMKAGETTLEKIWSFLKNLNIDLPNDPGIPLLVIYSKECNTGYSRGTCTLMFIAALFTIVKLWNQPRCPTKDDWIKKMWYLYTMEFYSGTKKTKSYRLQVNEWN